MGEMATIQFRDDIEDGEPVQYHLATKLPGGRWRVADWDYEASELVFVNV